MVHGHCSSLGGHWHGHCSHWTRWLPNASLVIEAHSLITGQTSELQNILVSTERARTCRADTARSHVGGTRCALQQCTHHDMEQAATVPVPACMTVKACSLFGMNLQMLARLVDRSRCKYAQHGNGNLICVTGGPMQAPVAAARRVQAQRHINRARKLIHLWKQLDGAFDHFQQGAVLQGLLCRYTSELADEMEQSKNTTARGIQTDPADSTAHEHSKTQQRSAAS